LVDHIIVVKSQAILNGDKQAIARFAISSTERIQASSNDSMMGNVQYKEYLVVLI
jgi:hypothetical protein